MTTENQNPLSEALASLASSVEAQIQAQVDARAQAMEAGIGGRISNAVQSVLAPVETHLRSAIGYMESALDEIKKAAR